MIIYLYWTQPRKTRERLRGARFLLPDACCSPHKCTGFSCPLSVISTYLSHLLTCMEPLQQLSHALLWLRRTQDNPNKEYVLNTPRGFSANRVRANQLTNTLCDLIQAWSLRREDTVCSDRKPFCAPEYVTLAHCAPSWLPHVSPWTQLCPVSSGYLARHRPLRYYVHRQPSLTHTKVAPSTEFLYHIVHISAVAQSRYVRVTYFTVCLSH